MKQAAGVDGRREADSFATLLNRQRAATLASRGVSAATAAKILLKLDPDLFCSSLDERMAIAAAFGAAQPSSPSSSSSPQSPQEQPAKSRVL